MKISIIMTSYNYAHYIQEAINSVINQSYQNWELIIVDDCSSDNSVEIIKSYVQKDSRIKFCQNSENMGLKKTVLKGLELATGDWVAFLESDDIFEPDNLVKKVEAVKKYPEVKLVFNKVRFLKEGENARLKSFQRIQDKLSKTKFPKNMFYDFGLDNMVLSFSCVAIEKELIDSLDFNCPFDEALDRFLWIQAAFKGSFYYIDEVLTNWRLHKKSYMRKNKKPWFYFPQVFAYFTVYKKDKKPLLLLFILFTFVLSCFNKLFRNIL